MARFSVEAIFKAVDRMTAPIKNMQNSIGRATKGMQRSLDSVNKTIGSMASGIAEAGKFLFKWGTIAVGAAVAGITLLVREFSKVEDAVASFTTLTGSVENATKLVQDLNEAAAVTPFRFEDLAEATNVMLGFGVATKDTVIPMLKMLGDVSGGNADKLNRITLAFSQIKAGGKASMQDINQLINAGVPIFGQLEKMTGKNVKQLRKMVEQGKITGDVITKAFEQMTSEGGLFFRGMEIASKTTSGMWSTLMDTISLTAAELGSTLAPVIKELIAMVTEQAGRLREWIKANKDMIAQRVAEFFKTLVDFGVKIVENWDQIMERARKWGTIAAVVLGVVVALQALAGVLTLINLIMAANPIVLAIMAAVAAMVILIAMWDEFKVSLEKVWDFIWTFGAPINFLIEGIKTALRWLGILDEESTNAADKSVRQVNTTINTTAGAPVIASPQARMVQAIENKSISTAELFIRDETGRAELKAPSFMPGAAIKLQPSGGF